MYCTCTDLQIWPLPCVWTATPAPWRSVGPACSRGGSGRGSRTCHRAGAAHSCPLTPPQPHPSLAPPQDSSSIHIMTPGSLGSWFQHPEGETWCSFLGGVAWELAASPGVQKTAFSLNLRLLLDLFDVLSPDFNTCLQTLQLSNVLRYSLLAFLNKKARLQAQMYSSSKHTHTW